MNYLIFNGVNSNTISGLVIQQLPPITKPAMRIQTTEIEGKDGDISDTLGWQSYNKTVQLGLFGTFDIDRISKYFTGSGDLIFSNEPDKVYKAEIFKQIDYERLVKFKTADVVFHVRPFKYLLNEPAVDVTIDTQTEISVTNQGLEDAKPVMTLYGDGIVEISINGLAQFQIDIDDEYVTVNSLIEEAYKDSTLTLKNRQMTGRFPTLQPGVNIFSWTGDLTEIEIFPMSRWL